MRIIKEVFSEDCFDGNFIKEYKLDEKVTDDWVQFLKHFGKMTYLKNLDQPFYSFDKEYFFTIKGLINEKKIKVIFRRNNMEKTMNFLYVLLKNYNGKNNNIKEIEEKEKKIISKIKQ